MQPSIGLGGCCRTITACGHRTQIVRLNDSSVVLVGERVNGMPRFRFQDVLELPLHTTGELDCFSDVTNQDKLELAHMMRTGHACESVLIEGFRRGLLLALD